MTIAGTGMTEDKSTKNGEGFMMRSPLTAEQTPRAMAQSPAITGIRARQDRHQVLSRGRDSRLEDSPHLACYRLRFMGLLVNDSDVISSAESEKSEKKKKKRRKRTPWALPRHMQEMTGQHWVWRDI